MCSIPNPGAQAAQQQLVSNVARNMGRPDPFSSAARSTAAGGTAAKRQAGGQIAAPVMGGSSNTILTSGDGVSEMAPTSKKTLLGQ